MKVTSKQVCTTVIHNDGTYHETVKKTVTVESQSFESMDIDEIHHAITGALRTRIDKYIDSQDQECFDKSISCR